MSRCCGCSAGVMALCLMLVMTWSPAASAQTQRPGGLYLAGTGAVTFPRNIELEEVEAFPLPANEISLDTGYRFGLALGYKLQAFRFEVEGLWGENDFNRLRRMDDIIEIIDDTRLHGEISTTAVMANAYADIPLTDQFDLYLGGGLGMARVRADVAGDLIDLIAFEIGDARLSGRDSVLAYQVMAGLAYHLSDRLAVTGGYRLWSTRDLNFGGWRFSSPWVHSAEVGLRYSF